MISEASQVMEIANFSKIFIIKNTL